MLNEYYASAAMARGFTLPAFIKVAMDEYIEQHPLKAQIPLKDVLPLFGIDEAELRNTEGIELE